MSSTDLASVVQFMDTTTTLHLLSDATFDINHLEDLVAAYLSSCRSSTTRTSEYTSFYSTSKPVKNSQKSLSPVAMAPRMKKLFQQWCDRWSLKPSEIFLNANGDHQVHAENAYLIAALVSGTYMRSGLCSCSDQVANITQKLQLDLYQDTITDTGKIQIRAVHGVLAVLTTGDKYPWHVEAAGAIQIRREDESEWEGTIRCESIRPLKGCTRLISCPGCPHSCSSWTRIIVGSGLASDLSSFHNVHRNNFSPQK